MSRVGYTYAVIIRPHALLRCVGAMGMGPLKMIAILFAIQGFCVRLEENRHAGLGSHLLESGMLESMETVAMKILKKHKV
jgi:hypothetical protein